MVLGPFYTRVTPHIRSRSSSTLRSIYFTHWCWIRSVWMFSRCVGLDYYHCLARLRCGPLLLYDRFEIRLGRWFTVYLLRSRYTRWTTHRLHGSPLRSVGLRYHCCVTAFTFTVPHTHGLRSAYHVLPDPFPARLRYRHAPVFSRCAPPFYDHASATTPTLDCRVWFVVAHSLRFSTTSPPPHCTCLRGPLPTAFGCYALHYTTRLYAAPPPTTTHRRIHTPLHHTTLHVPPMMVDACCGGFLGFTDMRLF